MKTSMAYSSEEGGSGIVFITSRISRRDRTCQDCRQPIPKGSRYERVFVVHDGDAGKAYDTHDAQARCIDYDEPEMGPFEQEFQS